jgi:hypothetical protein
MTTATQSKQSAQVMAEVQRFLSRVHQEFPTITLDQGFIDTVVGELKSLNVTIEDANERNFYAGFLVAKQNGSIQIPAAPPTAAELAVQQQAQELAEQQRLEQERIEHQRQQDEARQRLIRKQNDPRRHLQQETHNPIGEAVSAAQEVQKALKNIQEQQAQAEAETLSCFKFNGHIDRQATEQMRQIFVRENGAIAWRRTLLLRQEAAKNYEHQSRIKRDLKG